MLFISEEESSALISHEMAYIAIRNAFIASAHPESRIFKVVQGQGSNPINTFSIKASATEKLAGLKVGSYWTENEAKCLPRHNSLILLLDQNCGKAGVAIEAGLVNAYRTAAADAVATDLLARKNATVLTIFGTGHQAYYECTALARVRKIKQVIVVGRNKNHARKLVTKLEKSGISASIEEAEKGCLSADIIVTATSSRTPLFDAGWVKPGTHISAMGADAQGKQELPRELYATARLYCDLTEQSRLIGEFQHVPRHIGLTEISDVIDGTHSGRNSADEITIFDSSGISLQDLFIGQAVFDAWKTSIQARRADRKAGRHGSC
ncbi:ornithine cyclodeaminase family protein [Klebsiella pasteurii]|uniref:Ornithine cyclodeaminase family protein n=1 Tax=Klebsiella pasteurii TaxID=2587529 RepID=A0ABT5CQ88_9ENTR|nr:ornithine cyclodeaminase family protein [Klebsiella pasteurii]MBG2718512.1 ornithine cyclodeaminase family protein [Klebsiella michiganensis]MDC0693079.1 ornithine cyclodeaminase family protein [Klebsiella pasteurii]MDC0754980.1 ornithine cyclodeaminase family protein [Klebsiella pasteurii]MDQ2167705.1 ornithine cyclodeaminase family protein [Klebsiella pasteurii]MDQ2201386.1 ornithine cyclodeaminase family protein [Klebsiella pasteurii]